MYPGEEHPRPTHGDGTIVGRSALGIGLFEITVYGGRGAGFRSGQWAPFRKCVEGGFWFAFEISSLRDRAEWVVLCAQRFPRGRFRGVRNL